MTRAEVLRLYLTRKSWREVRKEFFSAWDRDKEWRLGFRAKGAEHGRCYPEKKVITICVFRDDLDERDALTIHEICHAVTSGTHGEPWLRRMEKAVKHSQSIGRDQLAGLLQKDVDIYRSQGVGSVREMYGELADAVYDHPHLALVHFCKHFASEYGMSVSEYKESLPRAERVYLKAKLDREQYDRKRNQFRETHPAEQPAAGPKVKLRSGQPHAAPANFETGPKKRGGKKKGE